MFLKDFVNIPYFYEFVKTLFVTFTKTVVNFALPPALRPEAERVCLKKATAGQKGCSGWRATVAVGLTAGALVAGGSAVQC